MGLLNWLSGKEPTCQCRRHRKCGFDPWVGEIPWRRKWQLSPVFKDPYSMNMNLSKLRERVEDRGSWHAAVHGMGKSQTQLSNRTTTTTKWNILLILLDFPCGLAGKESICNAGDLGLIPGLGRSPGEGKGYPLLYSGLDNSMDCIVHGVAKSWTRLSNSLTHSLININTILLMRRQKHENLSNLLRPHKIGN